jgi:hypothetical protein
MKRVTELVIAFAVTASMLCFLAADASAAKPKNPKIETWNNGDTSGAETHLGNGCVLTLVAKWFGENTPYVAVRIPVDEPNEDSIPPIAVTVEHGKIRVQLGDGDWWANVSLEEVIREVKKKHYGRDGKRGKSLMPNQKKTAALDAQSPFQFAAWGRGGCASCQGGNCQAEAPVVTTMPDQAHSVRPTCSGEQPLSGSPLLGVIADRPLLGAPLRIAASIRDAQIPRRIGKRVLSLLRLGRGGCG